MGCSVRKMSPVRGKESIEQYRQDQRGDGDNQSGTPGTVFFAAGDSASQHGNFAGDE